MNKKSLFLMSITLLAILIIPTVLVNAQEVFGPQQPPKASSASSSTFSALGTAFNSVVTFFFYDFAGLVGIEGEGAIIMYTRLLLWLVLFTLFYALLGRIGMFQKKNIRLPISLSISIISAIFIPPSYIQIIGYAYGYTVSYLIMMVPVIAVLFLTYVYLPTSPDAAGGVPMRRFNHGVKAVIFYLLATLLQNYSDVIKATPIGGVAPPDSFGMFSGLVVGGATILFFYHLVMMLIVSENENIPAPVGGGTGGLFDWLNQGRKKDSKDEGIPGREKGDEKTPQDFGPIVAQIDEIEEFVNDYNDLARDIRAAAPQVAAAPDETDPVVQAFEQAVLDLREMADNITAIEETIAESELLPDLPGADAVRLGIAIRRFANAVEVVIEAIEVATR